ncbi:hypothetical protein NP493_833g00012 [Ridgeia piscesae]|uniref:Poly [ADP-ribose] polymerase n=1 Tax=Ridgeia piscesae TaxID=27915 RepID=A0AAD9KMG7_RIDPI|nr:hypothetical protein NP493_833g00012 [Ridgeia piscesae]
MCDKECTEIVLNSKAVKTTIAKLTSGQMSQIKLLQGKLGVKIDICKTSLQQRIVVRGTAANTNKARAEILEIFIHVVETEGKERVASVISKQFQWKYGEGAVLRNYPPTINYQLELAYQDKKDGFKWKEEETGDVFMVLFDRMIERSNRNSSSVKVERCVIGDDNDLPANWSTVADTEHVKLEVLKPSSTEYQDVENKFMMSAQGGVTKVIKIERVQNPGLYRQFMLRKEEMKKRRLPPAVIERSLWHGTSADAVQNINMGGFNRSYCGKNATAYGNGVYFAVDSEYSTRFTYSTPDMFGEKRVYKSLVLTGDFTSGRSAYRVPPDNPNVPGFKYDTVVDNVNSPGIFVVFLDNQAYPEYLITFQ